jgi:metal-responsive CopG/Arc/MetJ family transcriptional regulator
MGKTSSAVKNKYNAKTYKRMTISLKKELVEEWEIELNKDGIKRTEFIRNAIEKYLDNKQF